MTQLAIIAAVARNGTIGKDNGLVWQCREDQQHFRRTTMGSPVIMGRKTWESLPARFRPLPGRRNIVLSRDPHWQDAGAEAAASFDAALALLAGTSKAWVIGGAQLYALALPRARELVLTEIDTDLPGDAHFPAWDRTRYTRSRYEPHDGYSFAVYERTGAD